MAPLFKYGFCCLLSQILSLLTHSLNPASQRRCHTLTHTKVFCTAFIHMLLQAPKHTPTHTQEIGAEGQGGVRPASSANLWFWHHRRTTEASWLTLKIQHSVSTVEKHSIRMQCVSKWTPVWLHRVGTCANRKFVFWQNEDMGWWSDKLLKRKCKVSCNRGQGYIRLLLYKEARCGFFFSFLPLVLFLSVFAHVKECYPLVAGHPATARPERRSTKRRKKRAFKGWTEIFFLPLK